MKTIRSQEGFVVVIVLIAILAMTFFLLTGVTTTASTMKVSGNYAKTVGVFNIAETGLAKSRPLLENQSFTSILTNYSNASPYTSRYLISPTSFNGGTYEVTLADDTGATENDGDPFADVNRIIKVTSTGRSAQGGRVQIETHLQLLYIYPPPPPTAGCATPPCDSATLLCGNSSDVRLTGGATIDGSDYNYPTSSCVGVACEPSQQGTPIPGSEDNQDILAEGDVNVAGSADFSENLGASSGCSQWQTFYNQWASISPSAPGVVTISGSTYTGTNDCSEPKVYLINTVGTLSITGNTFLCGMFILGTNASIDLSGTVTLVGLMVAMGNNSNLTYSGTVGTSNFYGKLIFRTTTVDSSRELELKGTASMVFSTSGMNKGIEAVNNSNAGGGSGGTGSLITAAWKENY